ncbi:MAG: HEAT repeat domain-containing protein [Pseudonocardiaceae bacterium]
MVLALVWALGHPLAERRLVAAQALGQRREARAEGRLRELVRVREDPYPAAAAVQALVSIVGRQDCADLLTKLATRGPAPVRRTAADLLSDHGGTRR